MIATPRTELHARIGRRVRQLRLEQGLTQSQLAVRVGVSNHFISGIERGVDSPSLMTLEGLASALQTSVAALVAEEGAEAATHNVVALERMLREKSDPELVRILSELIDLYRRSSPAS